MMGATGIIPERKRYLSGRERKHWVGVVMWE